ncbi:glycosyltransferase [Candidatus Chloroploca asiatica]|uniref:Glycosyl transferase family 1 n=1 Tax=Candidatus Chloroploca asiatica TaxID=1506545 RepID=A0A2H3KNR6_9CHLR|nr:glycosyltransferase [Candidatus Chloroploca asiatica]PDV99762.1 glycosyl transferase family 1 [Candidatus Chloroploca asiatica]
MLVYIAYPTSLTLQSANALQTYTTLRELRVRRPDTLALIPRWGREASRFEEVGAVHLPRPAIGKLSRLYKSTLLYYLEHTAFAFMTAALIAPRRHEVEAVYVRQVICAAWWAGVLGPRLGIPVIYEAHDLEARNPSRAREPWAEGLLHLIDRIALTQSSAVVSLTDDFRQLLATLGWRNLDEVFVVPDAYDEQIFAQGNRQEARQTLGLPAEAPIIAYAGMTFAHRWLEGLLAACAELRQKCPDLVLILAGGRDHEREALRKQAYDLGFGDGGQQQGQGVCLLIPPRPQTEIVTYLQAADVLAIPDTVTDITASPLKLFEYLALGQPIVLPILPALQEIVPLHLSHTFARRDQAGLTKALGDALARAPDRRRAMARRVIAAEHTYGKRAERILAVVNRIKNNEP